MLKTCMGTTGRSETKETVQEKNKTEIIHIFCNGGGESEFGFPIIKGRHLEETHKK